MANLHAFALGAILRWNANASHFQINARGGKSFLKTMYLAVDQSAHFTLPDGKSRLAPIEAATGAQPGIVRKWGIGVRGIPLKIGFGGLLMLKTPEKLDESLQLD
ncbi:hypothetical protein CQ12_16435 [Bradyrhizobium jicamae]|uniref:Uncharacterized protein n=1 Tax=Bradyrhizobium jicamae TaxID=280332 RepID=A0A0R3MDJ1_9BRAD|nr:hypothetical protein [Bradyrhizobium jicamae]KRR15360.1 hypothetical protein CQ12_16435 [Bradyrhizobium jicamae]